MFSNCSVDLSAKMLLWNAKPSSFLSVLDRERGSSVTEAVIVGGGSKGGSMEPPFARMPIHCMIA